MKKVLGSIVSLDVNNIDSALLTEIHFLFFNLSSIVERSPFLSVSYNIRICHLVVENCINAII